MLMRTMNDAKSGNRNSKLRWCRFLALSGVLIFCARAAWAQQTGNEVSLRDCINVALQRNVDLQIANEAVEESSALRASALGNVGPKVMVEGNVFRWDKPTNVSFMGEGGSGSTLPPPSPDPYQQALYGLIQGLGTPMTVRDQVTKSISLIVAQPLSQLYAIYLGYQLQDAGHEANQIRSQLSKQETVYRVTEAYLRVLQAKRYVEIAEAGTATVEAHLKQARDFAEAEVIARNDLLKAELAFVNAQGGLVKANAGYSLARAALANVVGKEISAGATFANPFGDTIPEV